MRTKNLSQATETQPPRRSRLLRTALVLCLTAAVAGIWLGHASPLPLLTGAAKNITGQTAAIHSAVVTKTADPMVPEPEDNATMETVVQALMAEYDLNEGNFSLCYYNTVTGESYEFNPDAWMVAASTYKLPLNLYYYEQEAAGLIDPESAVSGVPLPTIHYRSIVESNNELSHALIYNLGTFRQYKQLMLETYSDYDLNLVPAEAMNRNLYTAGFMMDVLQYLYPIADQYPELMEHLHEAMPGQYFKKYVTDYPIAHKYGSYDGAENDIGIVYTEEPYLLTVYTYQVYNGMDVVGRINEAVCAYNVSHYQPEPEPEPLPAEEPQPDNETASGTAPEPETVSASVPTPAVLSWLSTHLLTVFGSLGALVCLLLMKKRK